MTDRQFERLIHTLKEIEGSLGIIGVATIPIMICMILGLLIAVKIHIM